MADVNALIHWRRGERVREIVTTNNTDRIELDDATRQLISDLLRRVEALETKPAALRVTEPPVVSVMPDIDGRIIALEEHAAASEELSNALRMCLTMVQESAARTARLEAEAQQTHKTIATVMPALAAIAGR